MIALYIAGGLLATWVLLTWAFVAISHAKALRDQGHEFSNWAKWPLYLLLLVFAVTDIIFNFTFGTVIFRELPQELWFTSRVKRHMKSAPITRSRRKAEYWKRLLNTYDPGHV